MVLVSEVGGISQGFSWAEVWDFGRDFESEINPPPGFEPGSL